MDIAQGGYIMDLAGEAFLNNVTDEARLDSTFSDSESSHNGRFRLTEAARYFL